MVPMSPINLRWKASLSVSSLYAVLCSVEGHRSASNSLAELLHEPSNTLVQSIESSGLDVLSLLDSLVCLAAEYENNRQLVEVTLTRLYGRETATPERLSILSGAISGLISRTMNQRPELIDELSLRAKPLQEQWESRGPGLMRTLAQLTEEGFVAEGGEVVLVTPFLGGNGRAFLRTNRVLIEAVLTNPHPNLPETLRLGWLLAQLQADTPSYAEGVTGDQLATLAQLATIPAILAAAESVEWAACDLATIEQALKCWYFQTDAPIELAEKLLHWWNTYNLGASSWHVAWRALDAVLQND